jgi:hypothetical protein
VPGAIVSSNPSDELISSGEPIFKGQPPDGYQ